MDEQMIEVKNDTDIIRVRRIVREMAVEIGFGELDQTRIITAISELTRNIIVHASSGKVLIKEVQKTGKRGIEITCADEGPGIVDIELALKDGYTTSGGLGIGMTGARRLMDEFKVESVVGSGTTVIVKKWMK
ncbi:MAG: anti-sigma regulatory factor [Candidatus Syntropharchaeales archaeon]|nr:anti-sigma regulatory factor [Candidatus Syntrophoarchaeum sp.]